MLDPDIPEKQQDSPGRSRLQDKAPTLNSETNKDPCAFSPCQCSHVCAHPLHIHTRVHTHTNLYTQKLKLCCSSKFKIWHYKNTFFQSYIKERGGSHHQRKDVTGHLFPPKINVVFILPHPECVEAQPLLEPVAHQLYLAWCCPAQLRVLPVSLIPTHSVPGLSHVSAAWLKALEIHCVIHWPQYFVLCQGCL